VKSQLIACINVTIDGFCDHDLMVADDELHHHYAELLKTAGAVLYGRITYQLMEFWPTVVENPTGNEAMDEFAKVMDRVPKIVFSRTLKSVEWESARLAKKSLKEEISELKRSCKDKDIFLGSPSLIVSALNDKVVDELQLCVHPVIAGKGLPLFKNMNESISVELIKTRTLRSGAIVLYYRVLK
jgi:dihydrofolate reductase